MITLYGIKNCDTVKKTLNWLDARHISYTFHNYKKQGVDLETLKIAINQHGWKTVINTNGTSWRALPYDVKSSMNDVNAINVAKENPSLIKRPILCIAGQTYVGFKEETYKTLFN
jgi:Spx/MgsR family transcriptional regulator